MVTEITAPAVMSSKVYDGNTTAAVTAGTLTGVKSGDLVGVSSMATYNDATVGANKNITITYTLSGRDKNKYTAPVSETINTGEITKKQLTVISSNLTKTKMYDGNDTAGVTIGSLNGLIGNEDVSVAGNAKYENTEVGTNKKITVTYTLNGVDSGNYIEPINMVTNDGVITPIATLTASSTGITTSTDTVTVTLGSAISDLSQSMISVKRDGVVLPDMDYELVDLTTSTFKIKFLPAAQIEGGQAITVEINKPGYLINAGNPISVANTLLANRKSGNFNPQNKYNNVYINIADGTFKNRAVTKEDFIFEGPSANTFESGTFTRINDTQVLVKIIGRVNANHTVIVKGQVQATQASYVFVAVSDE